MYVKGSQRKKEPAPEACRGAKRTLREDGQSRIECDVAHLLVATTGTQAA